jgi:hypothetical protein
MEMGNRTFSELLEKKTIKVASLNYIKLTGTKILH